MISIKNITCSAIVLLSIVVNAQNDSLQISAELRPRTISDNGYKNPKTKAENALLYTSQRTRLNMQFTKHKIETYLSLQDIKILGDDDNYNSSGTYGNTQSIVLHQAWAKLKINEALSFKIGRQVFSYDDQRIISARNWNDYQVTYDALHAEYKTDKHRLHLGLSYNADNKSDTEYPNKKYKTFDFLHYQFKLDKIALSSIAVITGNTLSDSTTQIFYRGTYGVNLNYKTNTTSTRLSAYYQNNLNDISETTSAFCISAYADRKLIKKLTLGLGYDYLSGNDEASTSSTNKRFDILYGRRHGWYGYMDYFSTTPLQGLQDCMAKLTYKPQKNVCIELHYHYFMLAADKFDNDNPSLKLNRELGNELDLKIKWKLHKIAELECGYSIYKTTNTLDQVKTLNHKDLKIPQFCYLMLTIKPSFTL